MLDSTCWGEQIKSRIVKHHITRASLSYRYHPDERAFEAGSCVNMSICKWCRERLSKSLCPKEPPLEWPHPRLEDLLRRLEEQRNEAQAGQKALSVELEELETNRRRLNAFNEGAPQKLVELRKISGQQQEEAEKLNQRIFLYRDEIEGLHALHGKLNELAVSLETFLDRTRHEEEDLKTQIDQCSNRSGELQKKISAIEEAIKLLQGTGPCKWIEEGTAKAMTM